MNDTKDHDTKEFLARTTGLWQFQRQSKSQLESKIAEWNEKQSLIYPHCAICLLFSPQEEQAATNKLPVNTEIVVPDLCFEKGSKTSQLGAEQLLNDSRKRPSQPSDTDRKSLAPHHSVIDCLLQCKTCKLTVHQSCYMGSTDSSLIYGGGGAEGSANWMCDKCIWKATTNTRSAGADFTHEPSCSLCLLHGGALKQLHDEHSHSRATLTPGQHNKWAHLTCAVCIDGVSFRSPTTRSGIVVSRASGRRESRLRYECIYCGSFANHFTTTSHGKFVSNASSLYMPATGLTVRCAAGKCKNRFHVTCGYVYQKCWFEWADWPHCVSYLCHEHAQPPSRDLHSKRVLVKSIPTSNYDFLFFYSFRNLRDTV